MDAMSPLAIDPSARCGWPTVIVRGSLCLPSLSEFYLSLL